MPVSSSLRSSLFALCLIVVFLISTGRVLAYGDTAPSDKNPAKGSEKDVQAQESDSDYEQDPPDDELAPAAVQLDVSAVSPLMQELYQATRETKDQDVLARIGRAKGLIQGGADLKAADPQGRTALHWAIFGSSYHTKPNILVAYEEIADALIRGGVEINKQDVYQDTALDYLLYSPSFEIQTLLVENGATSGFLVAFYDFFKRISACLPESSEAAVAQTRKADLAPGATMSIRLDAPVYSDRSRTGDPIEATVTYPMCKNGEQLACKDGELLVSPGTKINGTILFAAKAPDKYSRPRLVLDFSNILHKDGGRTPLYARVPDVDNARETVRNNEILGIVQPHASKKMSLVMTAFSAANPIAGYTVKGVSTIYGLSLRREILFPAGTDIQVQVVRASMLKEKDSWKGWPQLPLTAQLQQLVDSAPIRTHTPNKTLSDVTNLMFIGSQKEIMAAFSEARWFEADNLNAGSALKVVQATMRQSGYAGAPVSSLLMNERPPDLVFQKSLNTFAKRHHVRIWKMAKQYNGRDVWVGAATHDIATTSSRANTKWSHRIDPHVDRERDWVETDLLFAGTAEGYVDVERSQAPRQASNATGDDIVTDGKMSVVQLVSVKAPTEGADGPVLTPRQ
jgi:hypothetical protein